MKIIKLLSIAFAATICFIACQKELNFDTNGISIGTLKKDAAGDCSPSAINGIYTLDSTLKAENFIDVNVDVTTVGTYEIKSDTINGFSFKGTGTFGVIGNNVVRLYGSGKPTAAGVSSFTITYGTSICVIDVTVFGPGGSAAVYTLGGAPGSCAGFTPNPAGTYNAGQVLVAANTVLTSVNVTATGTYDLGTDTVNGIYFRATNVFTTPGVQSITLSGYGTPTVSGSFNYHLTNGTTTCTFSITVGGGGPAAAYTLGGSPGNCTGVTPAGTYAQNTAMTSGNTVKVDVTVTTPGSYNLLVLAVNGVSFSAAGTFTIIGAQQVTLNASGTPLAAGPFNYVITGAGGTTCTFTITYTAAPPVANLDYIPMTTFSNWSTKLKGGNPEDTTYMQVSADSKTFGANSYRIFELKDTGTPVDSLFFRKNGGLYYQYFSDDFGILDAPYTTDMLVLDSTKTAGYTWSTNLGMNTAGGGVITIMSAKITGEIIQKGATAIVSGNNYNNVIKVLYTYSAVVPLMGGNITIATEERWYAKGYGVIYSKIDLLVPAPDTQEIETTRIQIF